MRIGRRPQEGWAVVWDPMISREQADLKLVNGVLEVTNVPTARNLIALGRQRVAYCQIMPGESFKIGRTTFHLVSSDNEQEPRHVYEEHSYKASELKNVQFAQSDKRLELITKLPSLISDSKSDQQLAAGLVDLILEGIESAEAVCVIAYDLPKISDSSIHTSLVQTQVAGTTTAMDEVSENDLFPDTPRLMQWGAKNDEMSGFKPSRQLIKSAIKNRETRLHIWNHDEDEPVDSSYTINNLSDEGTNWAFCTPLTSEACHGWAIYVAGIMGTDVDSSEVLRPDLRFAELMAEFIQAVLQVRLLENRQAGMSRFFSPKVMQTFSDKKSGEQLKPKVSEITVLWCELRNDQHTVALQEKELFEQLNRTSEALSTLSHAIMMYDGCVADFLGESGLAFWGWPSATENGAVPACLAAIRVCRQFRKAQQFPSNPLYGYRLGLGITHGQGIAGQIGPREQLKVGVFGPTVERAEQLEKLTWEFGTQILIDENVAASADQFLSRDVGRTRELTKVNLYTEDEPVKLFELFGVEDSALSEDYLQDFVEMRKCFEQGEWMPIVQQLETSRSIDPFSEYMLNYVKRHYGNVPETWDGTIQLAIR